MLSTYTSTLSKPTLYELLAQDISRQIESGVYRVGSKIPSVRQTSQLHGLSVTTVLQAYQLLETRGLVEARPQSGYYVRERSTSAPLEPAISAPPTEPCQVSVEELVMRVIRDARNPGLVQFGAAIPAPDLLPTKRLNRIMADLTRQEDFRQYACGIPEGIDELRSEVAKRAWWAGVEIPPEGVLITNGALEALNLSLRAVCREGDLVAVESPTYFGILQAIETLGLRVLEIPTHQTEGLSLEALRFALEHHPVRAVLVASNFSNPLGCCIPDEHKRELVELLAAHEIPLIEDDIAGEVHFDEQRPRVAKAYDTTGNVLLCSSFSKDLSPSLRVGWIAPGKYYNQILRLKLSLNLGTSFLPQKVVAEYLSSSAYDHHLRRIRRAYAEKMSLMSRAVLRSFPEGTAITSPRGGFVLWVQMPDAVDSLALYNEALKVGITLAPGHLFSAGDKYKNYIRLNAAYWSYQTMGALERLGEIVGAMC